MNCIEVFDRSVDEITQQLRLRDNRLFVFQHVPKTAGSSIHLKLEKLPNNFHWLGDNTKDRSWDAFITRHQKAPLSVLRGHMKAAHLEDLERRCISYHAAAFLRDPIKQTISHFRYCHSQRCPEHATLRRAYPDIRSFISRYLRTNFSTTYMVGKCYSADEAIEKIADRFSFVGLTEFYNTSMYLLLAGLGLECTVAPKANVTDSRHSIDELLTDSISQQIQELNSIDIEVFDFFNQRFGKLAERVVEHQLRKQSVTNTRLAAA